MKQKKKNQQKTSNDSNIDIKEFNWATLEAEFE